MVAAHQGFHGHTPRVDMDALEDHVAFIGSKLATAEAMIELHVQLSGTTCACDRSEPCGIRLTLSARREDFRGDLSALLGPTTVLPVLPATEIRTRQARRTWRWWWQRP